MAESTVPRLDFESGSIHFPERGEHSFLKLSDLHNSISAEPCDIEEDGVWLFRAESGNCGIVPGVVKVLRDGIQVIGLSILHHGDTIEIDGKIAKFVEIEEVKLAGGNELIGRRCQYCHGSLERGSPVVRCPLCGEGYHSKCWKELENKICCSRHCRFSPGPVLLE